MHGHPPPPAPVAGRPPHPQRRSSPPFPGSALPGYDDMEVPASPLLNPVHNEIAAAGHKRRRCTSHRASPCSPPHSAVARPRAFPANHRRARRCTSPPASRQTLRACCPVMTRDALSGRRGPRRLADVPRRWTVRASHASAASLHWAAGPRIGCSTSPDIAPARQPRRHTGPPDLATREPPMRTRPSPPAPAWRSRVSALASHLR